MGTHLVTGVAGFVGSHLAQALLQQEARVIGIDQVNNYYDPQLKRHNISKLKQYDKFRFVEADIRDLDWQELLSGVDIVYHQAAQAGVRASWGRRIWRLYSQKY